MMSELEKEVDRGKRGRRWFLVATWTLAGIAVVPLSIWLALLTLEEKEQGSKLRGVGVAGPCRAYGIQNDECQKQSRRIFAACYIQHEECWDKYELPRRRVPDPDDTSPRGGDAEGGGAQQTGSTGHQQTGPSGGRQDDQGAGQGDDGKSAPKRSEPPEAPGESPASSPPSASDSPGRSDPPAEPPAKSLPEQLTEKVEEVTDGVKEAAEGAGKTVDCALRGSCART